MSPLGDVTTVSIIGTNLRWDEPSKDTNVDTPAAEFPMDFRPLSPGEVKLEQAQEACNFALLEVIHAYGDLPRLLQSFRFLFQNAPQFQE